MDGPVTRRIVSIDGTTARTKGDASGKRDPWTLELTEKTYPRVVADVPWVGYPFISGGWVLLALIASVALVVAAVAGWSVPKRRPPSGPAPPQAAPYIGRPPESAASTSAACRPGR